MYAKAVLFLGNVVIDYVSQRKNLRLSTGVTKVTPENFKKEVLSAKVDDYINKNTMIAVKLEQVNKIIEAYFIKNKVKPDVEYVRECLKNEIEENTLEEKKYEKFEDYFKVFYKSKEREAVKRESLKPYNSTLNALITYQKYTGTISLNKINSVGFFQDFERFLSNPNGGVKTKGVKFRGTQGGLNNNTINKRLTCLKVFLRWCDEKKLITLDKKILTSRNLIKTFQPTVVTLDKEEQTKLEKLDLSGEEKEMRDILIFLCRTGIRYSDLTDLCKDDIKGEYIVKYAHKTDLLFKVPLTSKAQELIEKYNCNFNIHSTAYFNSRIKEILKKYKVCCYQITIREKRYTETIKTKVMKYSQVSSHTGRRTFIDNCLNLGFTIPQIMGFTGHTKVSSLQCYIDNFKGGEDVMKKIKLLD